jgi:hypothetical protein
MLYRILVWKRVDHYLDQHQLASPVQRNLKIRSVDELKRFGIGLDYNIAMNTEEFALESILNDLRKGIGETESW